MEQISLNDLAKVVADKHELNPKVSKEVIDTFLNAIVEGVKEGKKVAFLGFGSFEKAHRPERVGTNPSSGEKMTIAATDYPKFKFGASFKKAVK